MLIAIVGPTAVGKSALALDLAEHLEATRGIPGEIISADSRQVYRVLDIGTAKPTREEQRRVRHHLIDLVDPEDDFSLAEFQDRARVAIAEVRQRGAIPILVGGTGLYIQAVADGLELPRVPPDPALRARLEAEVRANGIEGLTRRLAVADPVAAARIDSRNLRRVIRALEVIEKTGKPFSEAAVRRPMPDVLRIGLTLDRERLYRVIDDRVDRQMAAGLVEETRRVLDRGCVRTRPALSGFGYRQAAQFLAGEIDLAEATQLYKYATHRFVRQQYAWFRLDDPSIQWFESVPTTFPAVVEIADRFIDAVSSRTEGAQR
jgi:tRNA dimethylallyltransferase